MTATPQAADEALPALRGELRLVDEPGGRALLFDPVVHRYVAIDGPTRALLAHWNDCRTIAMLSEKASAELAVDVDQAEVRRFIAFLRASGLVDDEKGDDWQRLSAADRRRTGLVKWLVHNYLFVRIPLVKPDAFLRRTLPLVAPLYTRAALAAVVLAGVAGLYLVSRQWSEFTTAVTDLLSLRGAMAFGVALVLVKCAHELGHAYTAVRLGCRVPTMGICFMVMVPMLYTDVSDAWKLRARRQRLAIDAAGLAVELALACVATLLWAFLPEGAARSVALVIATTSWLMSLVVNLNPFMRFDGYYLASDLVGIENLQPRAFALARWRLREILFGLGVPPPEPQPPRLAAALVLYAWLTWLYRLVVFTGIAVFVYAMSFKVLGIALFAIEIVFFIAWPVWAEIREWAKMRSTLWQRRRTRYSAVLALAAILAFLVPWRATVSVPAVLEPSDMREVYPKRAGRIVAVHARLGDHVEEGAPLVTILSPQLAQDIETTRLKRALVRLRLARRTADAADLSESIVLADELRALDSRLDGLAREAKELTIFAPVAGDIVELNPDLHVGRTLPRSEVVARIRGASHLVVRGYVAEDELDRLVTAKEAVFSPENLTLRRQTVSVVAVDYAGTRSIPVPELTARHGGAIVVRDAPGNARDDSLVPTKGQYLLRGDVLAKDEAPAPVLARRERGTLLVEGAGQSLAVRMARQVLRVLVRESGA